MKSELLRNVKPDYLEKSTVRFPADKMSV